MHEEQKTLSGFNVPTREESKFDYELLNALGCLRMLNFAQILYVGRKLAEISDDDAYNILWRNKQTVRNDKIISRLRVMLSKNWIVPWRMWDVDTYLTRVPGTPPTMPGTFYYLGVDGKKHLLENLKTRTLHRRVDDIYVGAFPVAQWVTGSVCALTLAHAGYILESVAQLYSTKIDVPIPKLHPDFLVRKDDLSGRLCGRVALSPTVDRYVGNIAKALAVLPPTLKR